MYSSSAAGGMRHTVPTRKAASRPRSISARTVRGSTARRSATSVTVMARVAAVISGILHALQDARVDFILIGALARVLHGSDETTAGLDLTASPRPDNLERLDTALDQLGARELRPGEGTVRTFESPAGRIVLVPEPAGTRG
jgi:hypothetical protein